VIGDDRIMALNRNGVKCACLVSIVVLALGLTISAPRATAGTPAISAAASLTAFDGATGDQFGDSLAISAEGTTVLVGAPGKTVRGAGQSGVVYIYVRSAGGTWSRALEIADPHPGRSYGVGSMFGASAALSARGDIAVIGAPRSCDPSTCTNTLYGQEGAVYVYTRTNGTWTQTAVLSDPQRAYRDNFGMAVSLSGDGAHLLIGAPGEHAGNGPAAAYIFSRSGTHWAATATLKLPDPENDPSYSFGSSVAIARQGTLSAIGAPHAGVRTATDQGTAYLYTNLNGKWSQAVKVTALDGAKDDEFGTSVAVSQSASRSIAMIGSLGIHTPCPCSNPTGSSGDAYVFSNLGRTWKQAAELHDPARTAWDGFGGRITLSADGSRAMIGAFLTYWWQAPVATGRAYLFANVAGKWQLKRQFTNPNKGERDYYGGQLAFNDAASTYFIAAGGYPGDTASNAAQGIVYLYQ
jgi:FG-GAP repeat